MQGPNSTSQSVVRAVTVGTAAAATDPAAQSSNPLVSLPFFASANDFTCGPSLSASSSSASQPSLSSPDTRMRSTGNSSTPKTQSFSWTVGTTDSSSSPANSSARKRKRPVADAAEGAEAPSKPAKSVGHPRAPTGKIPAQKQKKSDKRPHNHDSNHNHAHSSTKSPSSQKSPASHKAPVTPSSARSVEGSPHASVDSGEDSGSHDHSHADPTGPPKRSRNPSRPYARYACIPCRNMKVACDDARPCSRCIRRDRAALCQDVPGSRRAKPGLLPYDDPQRAAIASALRGPATGLSPPGAYAAAVVAGNPNFPHFQSPKQVPIPARPLTVEESRAAAAAAAGYPGFAMHPMAGFNPAMMHPLAYPHMGPMMGLPSFPFQSAFPMDPFLPTTMTANWSLNSTLFPAGMQLAGAPGAPLGAMVTERATANITADAKPAVLSSAAQPPAHHVASPKSATSAAVADSAAMAEALSRIPPPPPSSFSELLAQADKALGPSAQLATGADATVVKAEPGLPPNALSAPSTRTTSETSAATTHSLSAADAEAAAAASSAAIPSGIVVPTPKLASKTSPVLPAQSTLRPGPALSFPFQTDASQLGIGSSLWRPMASALPPNLAAASLPRAGSSPAPPASAVPSMTAAAANPGTAGVSVPSPALSVPTAAMQVNPQLFSTFSMFPPWMAPAPMFFPSPLAPSAAPPAAALPTDRALFPPGPTVPGEARSRTPERDSESLAAVASTVLSPGANTVVTQGSERSDAALLGPGPSFEKLRKLNYAGSSNASIQSNAASEGGDETIDAISSATRSVGQPDAAAAAAAAASVLVRVAQGERERAQPSPASSDSQSNGANGKGNGV